MLVSPVIDEVPAGLRSVVARLLDPEPARRPATAGDVRGLLRPLVGSETPIPFTGPARALHDTIPAPTDQAPSAVTTPNRRAAPATDPTVPLLEIATPPPGSRVTAPASQALTIETPTPRPSPNVAARVPAIPTADSLGAVPAAGRRGGAIAVLAVVVLIAVVVGVLVASRGGGGTRAVVDAATGGALTEADATATPPAPSSDASIAGTPGELAPDAAPAPVRSVMLTIRSKPPGARVTVDGQPVGIAPVEVPVPESARAIVVEVESSAGVTRRAVVPDRDRTLTLTIRRPTTGTDRGSGLPF
jgi:hypothetical protein